MEINYQETSKDLLTRIDIDQPAGYESWTIYYSLQPATVADGDYLAITAQTLTFAPGQTSQTVTVTVIVQEPKPLTAGAKVTVGFGGT